MTQKASKTGSLPSTYLKARAKINSVNEISEWQRGGVSKGEEGSQGRGLILGALEGGLQGQVCGHHPKSTDH